jgi:hypothetical protein
MDAQIIISIQTRRKAPTNYQEMDVTLNNPLDTTFRSASEGDKSAKTQESTQKGEYSDKHTHT